MELKKVTCFLTFRYVPETGMLAFAGALEYKGARSVCSGAKAGVGRDEMIAAAIKTILDKLKEPVEISLVSSPPISDNVFGRMTIDRLDLRFNRNSGTLPDELTPALDAAEQYAAYVLGQQRELAVIGAFVNGLRTEDGWVPIIEEGEGRRRLDCHESMFVCQKETQMDLLESAP